MHSLRLECNIKWIDGIFKSGIFKSLGPDCKALVEFNKSIADSALGILEKWPEN